MDRVEERKEIIKKIERINAELEQLRQNSYWGFVAEYELGLLVGSSLLLKKLREDI